MQAALNEQMLRELWAEVMEQTACERVSMESI